MIDLFNQVDPIDLQDSLRAQIGKWVDVFDPYQLSYLTDMLDKVEALYERDTIYPDFEDILQAYYLTDPCKIKVVIIGKAPYPDGNATGIAMGCKISMSKTLDQFYKAVELDTQENFGVFEKSMQYLLKQGVLLLNRTLTTPIGNTDAHMNIGWDKFIIDTVNTLNRLNPNVIYLLWGSHAKSLKLSFTKSNTVLVTNHPVAAARANSQWVTDHFSKTNKQLIQLGQSTIQWI